MTELKDEDKEIIQQIFDAVSKVRENYTGSDYDDVGEFFKSDICKQILQAVNEYPKLKDLDSNFSYMESENGEKHIKYKDMWFVCEDNNYVKKLESENQKLKEKWNKLTTAIAKHFDIEDIVWNGGEYDFDKWFTKLKK